MNLTDLLPKEKEHWCACYTICSKNLPCDCGSQQANQMLADVKKALQGVVLDEGKIDKILKECALDIISRPETLMMEGFFNRAKKALATSDIYRK